MKKLSVRPRKSSLKIPIFEDGLAYDEQRRLRNALLALAQMDPGWMWWVEKNIPKGEGLRWKRRTIERQARVLVAHGYKFLGKGQQIGMIYADYYFTDDGSLKTYL